MNNILITGGTGFVGSHLANYLSKNNDNKILVLCRSLRKESTFKSLELDKKKNIDLIVSNIGDSYVFELHRILLRFNIDTIYHLAAETIVSNAAKSPVDTYRTNVLGTVNLLEAVRKVENKKISVLVMSSDKAYGSGELPYEENQVLNGLDIYSSSKVCEDVIARTYANEYGMNVVVARPCNIIGEYDTNSSRIIPQFVKVYKEGGKLVINKTTSGQVREYIYVEDLVKALTLLVENIDKTRGQAYNISSGDVYSVDEILEIFKKITGFSNIEYVIKEKGFKEIKAQYLDCSKLKELGWEKEYEFEDVLEYILNE